MIVVLLAHSKSTASWTASGLDNLLGVQERSVKVYTHEECIEHRRRFKVKGIQGHAPQKFIKSRVSRSEMPFPTISQGHFNKICEGKCSR